MGVTTFAAALNATMPQSYSRSLPDVVRAADRCWCDFSTGGFFEPFNVTHWEYVSVLRLKDELEHEAKVEEEGMTVKDALSEPSTLLPSTMGMPHSPSLPLASLKLANIDSFTIGFTWRFLKAALHSHFEPKPPPSATAPLSYYPPDSSKSVSRSDIALEDPLPLIRREYDLRPYGLGILIDFGWTR